jgi:phage tail sheath protein FI
LDTEPTESSQEAASSILPGLLLDPKVPQDLDQIISLQIRVVELAERLAKFVVLLDVPIGLTHRQVLRWRSRFHSSYAAAYHPWLLVSREDDRRDGLLRLNPSAVAAGIIARQEISFGLPHGPANAVAADVIDVEEAVAPARHDELHQLGINVYLSERDGIRLTAGRTLARDPRYRQLTVRRLMLLLRRALSQQTHWMVFETNSPSLWADVRHMLRNFLRTLYQAGAFTGATEDEAFFVRCDKQLNTQRVIDAGQLLVEIGIAPCEPVEFIVLRMRANADGTILLEE